MRTYYLRFQSSGNVGSLGNNLNRIIQVVVEDIYKKRHFIDIDEKFVDFNMKIIPCELYDAKVDYCFINVNGKRLRMNYSNVEDESILEKRSCT